MTPIHDVVVVGAGPAGSAAAIRLARSGRSVVLVDKAGPGRDKCCGDALTALALRLSEELGVHPGSLQSWRAVDSVRLNGPSGRTVAMGLPTDRGHFSVTVRRREYDAALVDRARSEGADLHLSPDSGVVGVSATPDHVAVELADGRRLKADFLIAADGMWSPTRRLLGLGARGYRGEWHAARQYLTGVAEQTTQAMEVWFEPDLLPGYAWSFPLADGTVNFGFGVRRGGRFRAMGSLSSLWSDLLDRPRIRAALGADARQQGRQQTWPIPARIGGLPLTGPRTLFVGDAAAATDPMTGEGIGQALLTGVLAARAVTSAGDRSDPDRVAQTYSTSVRAGLRTDHRLAEMLSGVLASPRRADLALRAVDINSWTRANFGRWLFEEYPRALLATPRRWRRGVLRAGGGYA